jgi:hypothetical protein
MFGKAVIELIVSPTGYLFQRTHAKYDPIADSNMGSFRV